MKAINHIESHEQHKDEEHHEGHEKNKGDEYGDDHEHSNGGEHRQSHEQNKSDHHKGSNRHEGDDRHEDYDRHRDHDIYGGHDRQNDRFKPVHEVLPKKVQHMFEDNRFNYYRVNGQKMYGSRFCDRCPITPIWADSSTYLLPLSTSKCNSCFSSHRHEFLEHRYEASCWPTAMQAKHRRTPQLHKHPEYGAECSKVDFNTSRFLGCKRPEVPSRLKYS